jgi:methylated-DNA-protein-cysteine methyltransferase related protein
MGKSLAFARIRREVLEFTLQIPYGRVVVCTDLANRILVMPRHVAYILATLDEEAEVLVPWYRVVSAEGSMLGPRNRERAQRQAALLRAEGVAVTSMLRVQDLGRWRFDWG